MLLLLTILGFFLTAVSAILALLAQTWAKDKPIVAERLRWTSIVCIVLVFAANAWKEHLVDIDKHTEKINSTRIQGELQGEIKSQSGEVRHLRDELKSANKTILDTRTKLVEAQFASQKTSEAIQAHTYDRLSLYTGRFLTILGNMIAEASDGWLPSDKQEFFSSKSVHLICFELNSEGRSPVVSNTPWYGYFAVQTKEYGDALTSILSAHGSQMPPNLIRSVSEVMGSMLLWYPISLPRLYQLDREYTFKRPPMLCPGLEEHIEKSFVQLKVLVDE